MSRDHRKLRVFALADGLVPKIYLITQQFPAAERFGLQSQLRRAAVSSACNIVEGCARRGTNEYLNFLNIAVGSASEVRYLVDLSCRLGFLREEESEAVTARYTELAAGLVSLINSLSPEP
jgi:four helix bundle protein